jgi:hypothetical protein
MVNLSKKPIRTVDGFGNIIYTLNGIYHREDGPAVIYSSGSQWWYKNNERHREDGPAIISQNGSQCWYKNDKLIKQIN